MPRKGQSQEKIIFALRQVEAGKKMSEVCREMGVSSQAFYSWKRRFAGLGVSELREENQKLKTLVADLTLDKHILQDVLSKKSEDRGLSRVGAPGSPGVSVEREARLRADADYALDPSI